MLSAAYFVVISSTHPVSLHGISWGIIPALSVYYDMYRKTNMESIVFYLLACIDWLGRLKLLNVHKIN